MSISPQSLAAFEAIKPVRATQRQQVLDTIRNAGSKGVTREEIGLAIGKTAASICPRVHELKEKGYVIESGVRPTLSGINAGVLYSSESASA